MSSSILPWDDPAFEDEMDALMALPLAQKEAGLAVMTTNLNTKSANLTEKEIGDLRGKIIRWRSAIAADDFFDVNDGKMDAETEMLWGSFFTGYANGATQGCVLCFPAEDSVGQVVRKKDTGSGANKSKEGEKQGKMEKAVEMVAQSRVG